MNNAENEELREKIRQLSHDMYNPPIVHAAAMSSIDWLADDAQAFAVVVALNHLMDVHRMNPFTLMEEIGVESFTVMVKMAMEVAVDLDLPSDKVTDVQAAVLKSLVSGLITGYYAGTHGQDCLLVSEHTEPLDS